MIVEGGGVFSCLKHIYVLVNMFVGKTGSIHVIQCLIYNKIAKIYNPFCL